MSRPRKKQMFTGTTTSEKEDKRLANRQEHRFNKRDLSRFTVADLVALLRSLPKPDPGFWDTVEAATKQDTDLPPSPWGQ